MTTTTVPRLTEREHGGWIALSPEQQPLRIAVLGDTRDQAEAKYSAAIEAWKRLLELARARGTLRS